MRIDERCGCGASITVQHEYVDLAAPVVWRWRAEHRHFDPTPPAPDAPHAERESFLDTFVELSDPHPEPDRPIGFRTGALQ